MPLASPVVPSIFLSRRGIGHQLAGCRIRQALTHHFTKLRLLNNKPKIHYNLPNQNQLSLYAFGARPPLLRRAATCSLYNFLEYNCKSGLTDLSTLLKVGWVGGSVGDGWRHCSRYIYRQSVINLIPPYIHLIAQTMQLTVLSTKLSGQTNSEFEHEFRVVHAAATKDMARSLGIITRYVQGVVLSAHDQTLHDLPLTAAKSDLISYAQLTWPSTAVLGGALKTSGYKNSAGKHIFANTDKVFMTEPIGKKSPSASCGKEINILVMTALIPLSSDREVFTKAWNEHADKFSAKCTYYQRNQTMPLTLSEIEPILGGSLFLPELCQLNGGYEEIGFSTLEEAQSFFSDNQAELRKSYETFCDPASFSMPMDCVVQYGEKDIGIQQSVVGKIVSSALTLKSALGV